ncbi:hypothetical protein MMC30_009243 [Trapelia coarctata]|nr:hypothetical protein [Trapelia coarctata]
MEESKSPLTSSFDELVSKKLEEWHTPGVSIAVVHDSKVYAKVNGGVFPYPNGRLAHVRQGYGIATYPSEKVTPSTLFYTGSTTKAFLGAAWARLIESDENQKKDSTEKLSYDTPLATLIRDDFIVQDDYATTHITIEDALSHRTGMPAYDLSYGGPIDTPKKLVRNLRRLPLAAELRSKYQYCNTMYAAASHAFEIVTGEWLGKTLKETIWEPLGMHDTFFSLQDAQKAVDSGAAKLARGCFWEDGGEGGKGEYVPEAFMSFPEVSGAGCIISNVLDYSEWLKALTNCSAPLNEKILDAMLTPRTIVERKTDPWDGVMTYALGWALNTYRGEIVILHTGGLIGFGTYLLFLPNRKWGVVLMANTTPVGHKFHEGLAMALLDNLLEVPSDKRLARNLGQEEEKASNPRDALYPSAPSPGVPKSLSLEAYAGKYYHPGFQYLTFSIVDHTDKATKESSKVLFAGAKDRCWPTTFRMEHVSSDYFIAWIGSFHKDMPVRAEFRIGVDRKVAELGIAMEVNLPDKIFWFKRVD